jgi:hypothetical protein
MTLTTEAPKPQDTVTLPKYGPDDLITELPLLAPPTPAQHSLMELIKHFQLQKFSAKHLFSLHYERYLKNSRPLNFSMLEFGVGNATSLKMWASYFANGQVFGLDTHATCAKFAKKFKNIHISIGNPLDAIQMPKSFIHNFDLIIDEATHQAGDIIKPFKNLWPKLKSGGLYVIEDPLFQLNKGAEKQKSRGFKWFKKSSPSSDEFSSFLIDQFNTLQESHTIDFIHLYPMLCILRKK